jgi:hypothetical protein
MVGSNGLITTLQRYIADGGKRFFSYINVLAGHS